jgi:hypothetical protein
MFVRIRVEVDENNRKEKEMIEARDAKISSGIIEFDLPEDLKSPQGGSVTSSPPT